MIAGFVFEVVATFLFLVTILGVTQNGAPSPSRRPCHRPDAGGDPYRRHSGDRAFRSTRRARLGRRCWVMGDALGQLWLFIVAPLIGAGLAGLAFRAKLLSADEA